MDWGLTRDLNVRILNFIDNMMEIKLPKVYVFGWKLEIEYFHTKVKTKRKY